ncbi:YcaO-like family protein [Microlunatus flavus]|uniref:Ribosomal protein S12 methylthiotransferase accessory factor n=1 Tax=Microlunatus flavus TaxID=1036181 RepID=A0A1H9CUW4_9ACTN|nr:YcaO-like family protein [Microlunatus flavus]SEQ04975.1 ribosomal protein S12 methylthiotransferase accessory factor [Microlunatus flavus]
MPDPQQDPAEEPSGALADAADAYEAVLGRHGEVVTFDISSLDHLGVPVTSSSLLVDGRFAAQGNGYGLTPDAARVSGLGELAEGVLAADRVRTLRTRARREAYADLVRREGADRVAHPATLCLPAGSPWEPGTVLDWVPLTRVRTGEEVWAPLDLVASDPADVEGAAGPGLVTPVTNGLGAGLDEGRPVLHGLLEVLQRHTNGLRFRALDARSPEIDVTGLADLDAEVAALAARFAAEGVEPVFKHAATAYGVCSTYVMGVDGDDAVPVRLTAGGEAADPSVARSLLKALLEHANSRARKAFCFGDREAARAVADPRYWAAVERSTSPGEPRAVAAMRAWHELGADRLRALTAPDRSRSVALASTAVPDARRPGLPGVLDALDGHDVLAATGRDGDAWVAKVLATGLEVETMSYGRIGELGVADLLTTDLGLVRVGDGPTEGHPARVVLTADAEERLGGPAWFSYAAAERVVGPLYPLYREPPRHLVEV